MRAAPLALVLALLLGAPHVCAHGGPRPLDGPVSALPPGPRKRALLDLLARAHEHRIEPDRYHEPFENAVRALARARGARDAGDMPHAALLERLAGEWTRVAATTIEADLVERALAVAARTADARVEEVARARTLLEETQAQVGRLEATRRHESTRPRGTDAAPATKDGKDASATKDGTHGTTAPKATPARPGKDASSPSKGVVR